MTIPRANSLDKLQRAYFRWLCSLVEDTKTKHNFLEFAWALHQKEFYPIVPNDYNRESDGKKLREDYVRAMNNGIIFGDFSDGACTVFEMMIGIAQRIDFFLSDINHGDRVPKWFWILVHNLNLLQFEDDDPDIGRKRIINDEILNKLIERRYLANGKGGLFPLVEPKQDQRNVEIWYQMQAWLMEKYPDD